MPMVLGRSFFNRLGARANSNINYPLIYSFGEWSVQWTVYSSIFSDQIR